jgi:hypothetical protein
MGGINEDIPLSEDNPATVRWRTNEAKAQEGEIDGGDSKDYQYLGKI